MVTNIRDPLIWTASFGRVYHRHIFEAFVAVVGRWQNVCMCVMLAIDIAAVIWCVVLDTLLPGGCAPLVNQFPQILTLLQPFGLPSRLVD